MSSRGGKDEDEGTAKAYLSDQGAHLLLCSGQYYNVPAPSSRCMRLQNRLEGSDAVGRVPG